MTSCVAQAMERELARVQQESQKLSEQLGSSRLPAKVAAGKGGAAEVPPAAEDETAAKDPSTNETAEEADAIAEEGAVAAE